MAGEKPTISRSFNIEGNESIGHRSSQHGGRSDATAAEQLSEEARRFLKDELRAEQMERTRELVDSAWQSLE